MMARTDYGSCSRRWKAHQPDAYQSRAETLTFASTARVVQHTET